MSDPNPKQKKKEEPKAPPAGELDDKSLDQVSGGFNPCPEPPGRLRTNLNPILDINVKIRPGNSR